MAFSILRSLQFDLDLDLIHDHLIVSYIRLGDPLPDAFDRAEARIGAIETDLDALARSPHQGTLLPDIASGMRSVTKNRAIFYFDVDNERQLVVVLAVFFGGQDHRQHMLRRLGSSD